jgi:acyl-coenzyme A thioesterase PaaI-like protein
VDTLSFAAVTGLSGTAPGPFTAEVHPEWTIGGKPNGGYLLAMLGSAATLIGPHPHVIAASAHYLAPPEHGTVTVEATVLRAGRSAAQFRARMTQGERVCVEALVTTATLSADTTPFWSAGVPQVEVAPPERCVRIPGTSPTGIRVAIMDVVDLRVDPQDLGFARGAPSGRGLLRGWLSLPDGEPFGTASLLYAVDSFPPATFEIEATGWVPTLELTAYVRALPAPGPVRVVQKAQLVDAQRVDESCFVWDSTGRLVAHATQLAAIRLG